MVFEILSPSTRDHDLIVKHEATLSISRRAGDAWIPGLFARDDLSLPALDLVIPHAEIFAHD